MSTPWIGLTPGVHQNGTHLLTHMGFFDALLHAGARPVALPLTDDPHLLADYVEKLDGFLFTGGGDLDPLLYGQPCRPWCGTIEPRRDRMELALLSLLKERSTPVLGICRGLQIMNVALGGTLYQDVEKELATDCPLAHRQKQPDAYPTHTVSLAPGSLLHRLMGAETKVNSLHHQGVRTCAPGFHPTAFSSDGLCEAAELEAHPFFVGVQWHPERMWTQDAKQAALFTAFVQACQHDVL